MAEQDLLAALQELQREDVEPPDRFRAELDRFVRVLSQGFPDAGASVEPGPRASTWTWTLATWPALRPEERSLMLTFHRTGDGVRVVGEEGVVLATPQALWGYLEQFALSDPFKTTLREYRLRNQEPALGMLRTSSARQISDNDVVVDVAADEVRRIHDTPIGQGIAVHATQAAQSTYADFVPGQAYRFLVLVGFVVEIAENGTAPTNGRIGITGIRLQ